MKFLVVALSLSPFAALAYSPSFTSMEVKISYPCGIEKKLNLEKEERERISFFDGNGNPLYKNSLILRKRVGPSGADFTVKYRATDNAIDFDKTLFEKLSSSTSGKLKCEIDMVFAEKEIPRPSRSCSYKTEGSELATSHVEFIKMTKNISSLKDLKEFRVESISHKIKLTSTQKDKNPFAKKPSVEMWQTRGECRLEVSGKFDIANLSDNQILSLAQSGFNFIQELVPAKPSAAQGNKTSWALGL